jgi:GH15 family glucan-1,4-alpha-glucosidase
MALNIADYGLIGDCHTAALVGTDGSMDWLCMPRFDSPSMFGALLGDEDNGRWLLAPAGNVISTSREYLEDTFILVTTWRTDTGVVEVTDFMPTDNRRADIVRRVTGIEGSVELHEELRIRFDYSAALPWVRQAPEEGDNALIAVAGPDAIVMRGPKLEAENEAHVAAFVVKKGQTVDLVLTWYPAHRLPPQAVNIDKALKETTKWWRKWAANCEAPERYSAAVHRSLLVLRALTHEDTGGIVAAATTSLPEEFGGSRNWDYRYVWLRDASLTLYVLIGHGFSSEAATWRSWLLRAIAGDPNDVQIMYGLSGERRLTEWEVPTLPGYRDSSPVRVGNGAFVQYQGDMFGEVMLALAKARESGAADTPLSWALQRALLQFVEDNWRRPDNGIWEIRGPKRHFTHSRAMLWAAFDCGVRAVREHGHEGPVERWEQIRGELAAEIESKGWDPALGSYTQFYGSGTVDASLLQLSQIGYVEATDPRMLGTVAAIESTLMRDGLVLRYLSETGVDGLPGGEHPFLACSFWLAEQYARSGRTDDAIALMDRLVGFSNDLGLLSEEYDVAGHRQAGNTPQALSHLALVRTADAIDDALRVGTDAPQRRGL